MHSTYARNVAAEYSTLSQHARSTAHSHAVQFNANTPDAHQSPNRGTQAYSQTAATDPLHLSAEQPVDAGTNTNHASHILLYAGTMASCSLPGAQQMSCSTSIAV